MKNLKFVFVALLICFFSGKIKAQTDSTKKDTTTVKTEKLRVVRLYSSFAIGMAVNNYFGSIGGISVTCLLSNNWGVKVNMKGYSQVAKDLPADYRNGFNPLGAKEPKDYLMAYSLAVIKEFTSSSPFARFGVEAGFSIIDYKKARFERQSSGGFFSAANYKIERKSEISIGLHFRAKAELKLGRRTSMELATVANINPLQSYVGGEIALNVGMLRRKTVQ